MNNHDVEKTRVTHAHQIEQQMQHLSAELDRYKAIAEKWEPIVTVEIDPSTQKTKFGLRFGGKNTQAVASPEFLIQMDTDGATSQITSVLIEGLVADQLAKVLRPEVERAQNGAKAVQNAGKW